MVLTIYQAWIASRLVQAAIRENSGILAPAFLFRLHVTGRAMIGLGVEFGEMKKFDA